MKNLIVNGKVTASGSASGPDQFSVISINTLSGTWASS